MVADISDRARDDSRRGDSGATRLARARAAPTRHRRLRRRLRGGGRARCLGLVGGLFHHFVVQLDDGLAQDLKDGGTSSGEMVVASAAKTRGWIRFTSQPPIALHPLQQRVQRARAHRMSVPAKLLEDPLTHHGLLGGVVQDVDLPEAEKYLPGYGLVIDDRHNFILGSHRCAGAGNSLQHQNGRRAGAALQGPQQRCGPDPAPAHVVSHGHRLDASRCAYGPARHTRRTVGVARGLSSERGESCRATGAADPPARPSARPGWSRVRWGNPARRTRARGEAPRPRRPRRRGRHGRSWR